CGVQAAVRPESLAELLADDVSCQEDANELQHRLLEMLEEELGGSSSPWNFLPSLFRGAHLQALWLHRPSGGDVLPAQLQPQE
ncbi:ubiquitin carboxyl-terminal, partial [Cyclospora cayetanensis]